VVKTFTARNNTTGCTFRCVRKIAKNNYQLRQVCFSVRMEQLGSHWMYFHEIWYLRIFRNLSRKSKFHQNLTRIMGTLHEDLCTFISHWILLRMRDVSYKSCRENQNTHFVFNNFVSENRAVYEIGLCGKIWYSQRGQRWQHNTAHALCMLDK
jgi:hypothetical protein